MLLLLLALFKRSGIRVISRPINELATSPFVFSIRAVCKLASEPFTCVHIRWTCFTETCDKAQPTVTDPQFGHLRWFFCTLCSDHWRLQLPQYSIGSSCVNCLTLIQIGEFYLRDYVRVRRESSGNNATDYPPEQRTENKADHGDKTHVL
jgi:hypothetical protein